MPTNLFNRPPLDLRGSVNQGLGFNLQNAIGQGGEQVMQDVEERRQMGRKKYAHDILTQQLQEAAQELENRKKGYEFGQEQEYYKGLHTPEGQTMWKAYQERLGLPAVGDVTNPLQIANLDKMSHEALMQEQHNREIAMHILALNYPVPGVPDKPEVLWARQVLGVHPTPEKLATGGPTPTPPNPAARSAAGVFMHEALPGVAGAGSAWGAARAMPGPPMAKGLAALGAYGLGSRLTQMAEGELTPEEQGAHPTAVAAGSTVGLLLSLLGGSKAYQAAKGRAVGSAPAGSTLASPITVKKPPIGQRLSSMLQRPQAPPQAPQYQWPAPGSPPSMSNVPGAAVPGPTPTMAPAINDPRLQALLNSLFKKQPIASPGLP